MRLLLALLLLAPVASAAGACVGPLCWSESGTDHTVCRDASETSYGTTRVYASGVFFVEGHQRCEQGTEYRNVLLVATAAGQGARVTWTSFQGTGSSSEVEAIAPYLFLEWKCSSTGSACGITARPFATTVSQPTPRGPPAPPALPWGHLLS